MEEEEEEEEEEAASERDEEVTSKEADQKKEEGLFKEGEEEHAGYDECLWLNERVFVCLECTLLQQLLSCKKKPRKIRIETETQIDFVRTKEIIFHVALFLIFERDMLDHQRSIRRHHQATKGTPQLKVCLNRRPFFLPIVSPSSSPLRLRIWETQRSGKKGGSVV